MKTFKNDGGSYVQAVVFSPDGKLVASGGGDQIIQLWNLKTEEKVKTFQKHLESVESLSFSPDSKTLASGSFDGTIIFWDVASGKAKIQKKHSERVFSVSFNPDGKTLVSVGDDATIKLWDVETGDEIKTIQETFDKRYISRLNQRNVVFSPNGNILASSGSYEKTVKLRDTKTWRELRTLELEAGSLGAIAFSPDGKTLAVGGNLHIKLFEVTTGKELVSLNQHSFQVCLDSFSSDGKTLASFGFEDKTIKLWNVTGNPIFKTLSGHSYGTARIMFSPDNKVLATGGIDDKSSEKLNVKLWNVDNGQEIKYNKLPEWLKFDFEDPTTCTDEKYHILTANLGKLLIRAVRDGAKIKLVNIETEQEIASLIALDENDWAVVTPDGLFDASPGARKLMHYVIGLEPISLEQMKDVYYVPNLLQKILKGDPLPKVELFSKNDLFPDVEFSQPKAGQKDLTVKLTNRGGGIGQVQILVNGKEFVKDARPANFDANTRQSVTLTVSLKDAPLINGAENKIEVVARNAAGSLTNRGTARGTEIIDLSGDKTPTETPHIYAIVGGISNYTGDNLKLNFAAKDAEDFARALELGAIKLLNGDKSKVHVRLLTSNGDKANVKFNAPDARISTATKADFQSAFNDFRNATPNDVFIVYLAGHGVSLNLNQNPNQAGGDTYLYLTQEATTTDKSVLAVENSRKAMAVSSEELKDLMKQNKALKQVLILDTCASGQAAESFVQKRDLPSDQIRAIERLKDNTGFYVLMGSAADAVSYEANEYGQGLLTYSLLQGMKGAALDNDDANVGKLFDYSTREVPEMAKNIGGIQQPRIITPDTSRDFPIGRFTLNEQQLISLSTRKPIILTPELRNAAMRFDNLNLTEMMTAQLRQLSYVQSRGEPSRIVFVDRKKMPDAVQPVGDYTIEGENLKISVILVKNNAPFGKEIVVSGKTSEPENLIKQIVAAITQAAGF